MAQGLDRPDPMAHHAAAQQIRAWLLTWAVEHVLAPAADPFAGAVAEAAADLGIPVWNDAGSLPAPT
jgi:hypothetical protein